MFLNSSRTAVTCSTQAQPTPALRWTKVGRREALLTPTCTPSPTHKAHALSSFLSPPLQDSVPLEDGPTLSLGPFTFDSAGTYVCEASVPSVPLLSRTQSFKLLVQGSGCRTAG